MTEPGTVKIEAVAFDLQTKQRGLWSQAFQRLIRNRLAMLGGIVLSGIVLMSVLTSLVPAIENHEPSTFPRPLTLEDVHSGPDLTNYLGTDHLGRDLWARMWEGIRISLRVGIGTQVLVLATGLAIGAGAALGGRLTENVLMRFTDLTYAFPDLLAIILLRAVLADRDWAIIGRGAPQIPGLPGPLLVVIVAISLVAWVTTARLVRGQMLTLKEADYVMAAKALGASPRRVVFVHMLPNTLGPVIVTVTFGIPLAIFAEAVLGFLGFSLPAPTASLGTLVNDGLGYYRLNLWELMVPSVAIATLMLCFTFIGDGLRDALDPRSRND